MNQYKRVVIFYFSGTGNAKRIALWLAEFAAKQEIDCQSFNIARLERSSIEDLDPDALIVIISPIHGFNFPKITLDFIRHFPKGKNNIVLMNTRAGMKIGSYITPGLTGIAFIFSSVILKLKGYKIVGQIPFDMPSNWISIHPSLNSNTVKYLHKENYSRVEKHANMLFSGKKDFHAYRDIIQDILIAPIALGYYLVGRFVFSKSYYASNDCDNCGLCVKQCPVKAIKLVNDRPYWTFNCESCMKCMNSCPKNAIETAHGLMVGTSIFSSVLLTYILYNMMKINIQSEFFRWILFNAVFFALLWILYRVQHILLRNRFISKWIAFTSLTHYSFWGRYKSISDDQWKE
jgi:ferredoxin/flavodoxin